MLEKNKAIHDFTGVSKFHESGYTGSRVSVATVERICLDDWAGPGEVFSIGTDVGKETESHARMTASVFFEVAPGAKLCCASTKSRMNPDRSFTYDLYDVQMPILEKNNVLLLFASVSTPSPGTNEIERSQKFVAENDWFTQFWSAGNDGYNKSSGRIRLEDVTGVAAYYLVNGKPDRAGYSSISDDLDFAAPTNIQYQPNGWANSTTGTGTSAAAPYLCGMAALVQDFFIDKTGRPLKRDALLRFFRDNCMDLETPGHDSKTGYGAVVLPDPDTIDIWKYQDGGEEMKVEDFKDADQISDWAKVGVQFCLDAGLMDGVGDGLFNPKGPVTREQLATVLERMNNKN